MIGYLRGTVIENTGTKLIVGLPMGAPSSGTAGPMIGYVVAVPQSSEYLSLAAGAPVELHIHTNVREDAIDLFGFRREAEKELFLTLIHVSGVGPKVALGILSAAEPSTIVSAILEGDKALLTRLPGIGKKTAERLIVELKDVIQKKRDRGVLGPVTGAVSAAGAGVGRGGSGSEMVRDAADALVGLGYRDNDVRELLEKVLADAERSFNRAEDLVREALRQLT